jgi:DNA repair exonuclease SbcCD nuclease subunit
MSHAQDDDMALTILHTADWHLGRRFTSFDQESELRLTRARLEVLSRILDLAQSRNVDAVLCAGDLFDSASPDKEWWQGALDEFKRRDWQRPVVLLPGNHDPLLPNSVFDAHHPFRSGLPDYVHVVGEDGFELPLGDKAVVYATPCRSHAGQTNLASSLPPREPGDKRIRIGLIHGQTFDIDGYQTNFPIPRGTANERDLDYLAIGDTHAFREVEPNAPVPTVYPSAPEATNFGEKDTGYVAVVFFPRDRARRALVEKERVAAWNWRAQTCLSLGDLRELRSDENLRKTVLRLKLDMTLPLDEYDEAECILTELKGSLSANPRVGVLDEDRSGMRLAIGDVCAFEQNLPPVLQSVVRRLQAEAAERPEVAERALHHLYQLTRD